MSSAAAAGGAAVPIIGGILGNMASQGQRQGADQMYADAYAQLKNLGYGPDLAKEIIMNKFKSAGALTPEVEKNIDLGISQTEQIQEDPSLRNAQADALRLIQQRGKTGLNPEDRAALNQVRSEVQRDAEAKRQQILQGMQARGMGGSGASLIAQLQAAQSANNQASEQGDTLAAQASRNALSALGQSSQMAGQMRGEDLTVNQTKAAAADLRNRFNVQNQLAQQQRNVQTQNQAQAANLQNQQSIQNANTNMANSELLRQRQAQQEMYQNALRAAGMMSAGATARGNQFMDEANRTADQWQKGASAVGQGIQNAFSAGSGGAGAAGGLPADTAGGTTQASRDYLTNPNY